MGTKRFFQGELAAGTLMIVFRVALCQAQPLIVPQHRPLIPPDFEEQRSRSGSAQYVWRSAGVAATLSTGGLITLVSPNGRAVHISFPAANSHSKATGEAKSPHKTFWYLGAKEDWREDAHFDRVRYSDLYPGIDLVFVTNSKQLEYNFELAPYANPKAIHIRYEGTRLSVDAGRGHADHSSSPEGSSPKAYPFWCAGNGLPGRRAE
jgi:hypothetical protein